MGIFSLIVVIKEREILVKSLKNYVKISKERIWRKMWAFLANEVNCSIEDPQVEETKPQRRIGKSTLVLVGVKTMLKKPNN